MDRLKFLLISFAARSKPYAHLIRSGREIPHPRHWLTLANLSMTVE
jgi:hypothetical protein